MNINQETSTAQIIEHIKSDKHEFIPTGFQKLDKTLDGGLLKKEMVVIGGSTGAGKSYLAIHLAMQAANKGFKTGYFSLEISNQLVVARMIGMKAGVKASHILYKTADFGDIELQKAISYVRSLGSLFSTHDDVYELNAIKQIVMREKYEFVIVDFVQNVFASGEQYERLSHISLTLQKLAKEANACILVLSQLSNEVARATQSDRPLEYKGSGSIATVADLGFFLAKNDDILGDSYELLLAKNRRGVSRVSTSLSVTWPGGMFDEIGGNVI